MARSGSSPQRHSDRGTQQRRLRIVAGRWRGRVWRFPPGSIRPTPDRVRETLFNWLRDRVAGARCLDLYAGSGALGLEALSRGAASVVFVEHSRAAAQALVQRLADWDARGATVICDQALRWLASAGPQGVADDGERARTGRFDLVFLDPPFAAGRELAAAAAALERGWLSAGALVYVECARRAALPALPVSWRPWRSGTAGEVGYHLLQRQATGALSS